ncbi:MAG: DEAD/DEAH box helicase family protein [Treponema sp.]|nr:DEAD/DEAH box helicase family protein [Treponema sp.]
MAKTIKFKFDNGQPHQTAAINSTLNLFKGFEEASGGFVLGDNVYPNRDQWFTFDDELLRGNYESVIVENNKKQNPDLARSSIAPNWSEAKSDGLMLRETKFDSRSFSYPVFTLEMETGTGKTYTYLKTMFEMKQQYGFSKFIIVVPSIAIYEGTLQALRQTKDHFREYYRNETIIPFEYKLNNIIKFATSQSLSAMIITIDSFNKAGVNVIYQPNDGFPDGLPIEYIQKVHPILILDENQNYTSEKSEEALRTLKPLFALNYSATPKKSSGLIYKLSPFDAFRENLVKKIEVLGVTEYDNVNDDSHKMALVKTINDKGSITATMQAYTFIDGSKTWQEFKVKKGDKLINKTHNPDLENFEIEEINIAENKIVFTNQTTLSTNSTIGITLSEKEVRRVQIEEAIRIHMKKQRELRSEGIKVLTLFFIDYVPHYLPTGGDTEPFLRTYFENAFNRQKQNDDYYKNIDAKEVHDGYFARKKDDSIVEDFDEILSKDREDARKKSFERIMKSKERLLSFDDKVCFIFAHSAIREGWDNPNVFNICLLKQPNYKTDRQKDSRRQELGRGLRICVNQEGERIEDASKNILTVICPEGYEDYVKGLQTEYIESGDIDMPPAPSNYKAEVKRNNKVYQDKDFRNFWNSLCQETSYNINIDTQNFIKECEKEFNDNVIFPATKIQIARGSYNFYRYTIGLVDVSTYHARIKITAIDINGRKNEFIPWVKQQKSFPERILKNFKDIRKKDFTIVKINEKDGAVTFSNSETITKEAPYSFDGAPLDSHVPEFRQAEQSIYPVKDFVSRTASVTSITRPTIIKIFNSICDEKKEQIFINPEGFTSVFIERIKELLANHVASKIEYVLNKVYEEKKDAIMTASEPSLFSYHSLDESEEPALFAADGNPVSGKKNLLEDIKHPDYFPELIKFPQRELMEGSEHSLYSDIQKDSNIEENFIKNIIQTEDSQGKIICYFKFPAKFKIHIPRILGNFYNPDWGIIRLDDKGNTKIRLVRETKGTEDITKLRFSSEGRKIQCGTKHFKAIGINYRYITDKTPGWYLEINPQVNPSDSL